jgi:DNA repair photolyase
MSRRAEFQVYQPKTILNKSKRANSLFWTRYSAYPYIGCQHGCHFCYCRERKFSPYEDCCDFSYVIKIKENAAELLRRALQRASKDVIFTGDYQPLERKFKVSRRMLEVCLEMAFPVMVLERSPLVLRDLDLLQALESKARAVVAFSILTTPGSKAYDQLSYMEGLAPAVEKRFDAMEKLAASGILTGTCLMPVLPGIGDDDENLKNVVRWTADRGGKFVLFGGLTLSDQQREYYMKVLRQRFPDICSSYLSYYPPGSYGPSEAWTYRREVLIHEWCQQFGIKDRMPRPVISGEKRAANRRIVEELSYQEHMLGLNRASKQQIWKVRKAAWAIEDLEQDARLIHRMMGLKGLQSIPGIGSDMAPEIERLIESCKENHPRH